jgi:hypothetical protein
MLRETGTHMYTEGRYCRTCAERIGTPAAGKLALARDRAGRVPHSVPRIPNGSSLCQLLCRTA